MVSPSWHAAPADRHVILLFVLLPFYVYILFSHSLRRIPLLLVSSLVFTETCIRIREVEETPFFFLFSGNVHSFFFPSSQRIDKFTQKIKS